MSEVFALLQGWLASAEHAAARVPELARALGAGSLPAAVLAGAAGLALLVAGVRLGRPLAAAGGAFVGWLAGGLLAVAVSGWMPAWLPASVAAAVLGLMSFLAPDVYPIALGLLPGALLGARVPIAGKAWLSVLGGLALALLALWMSRFVLAVTAAMAGAVLVVASLLALSLYIPALLVLARSPMLLWGFSALLAVAGTVFQLRRRTFRVRKPSSRKVEGMEGG
jgi:hypothetical protein